VYEGDTLDEQVKHIPAEDWELAMRYHHECMEAGRCMRFLALVEAIGGGLDEDSLSRAVVILERMVRSNLAEITDTPALYRARNAFMARRFLEKQ